ncbi:MAG TPA: DUF4352 domain-containing protein [Natronosporangium sp.]|nr:DUF4352 domain-containing protein [Natronosporangium sp.]
MAEVPRRGHRRTTGRTVIRPARTVPDADPPRYRGGLLALIATTGLALLILGPSGIAFLVRDYATAEPAITHHLGEPVQDGAVSFVVHQVRCGPHEDARHGLLCEVTLGARNTGESEVAVPSNAQSLHVSPGARHLPTSTGSDSFGSLAPGEAATAVLRYDLPADAEITQLRLRAGTYSRGVPVAVDYIYPLLSD